MYMKKMMQRCCACGEAKYQLIFKGLWSSETHKKDWPSTIGKEIFLYYPFQRTSSQTYAFSLLNLSQCKNRRYKNLYVHRFRHREKDFRLVKIFHMSCGSMAL